MSELCECGSAVCWGGCRAAVSTSDVAVLRSERDAALAELNALKLKYDELHDQRHEEARKADAALAEVARVTAERDALETMRTLGWEGMDLKAALSEALAEVERLRVAHEGCHGVYALGLEDRIATLEAALQAIYAIPSFPARDIAERALGIKHEPAPRSTAELRASLGVQQEVVGKLVASDSETDSQGKGKP